MKIFSLIALLFLFNCSQLPSKRTDKLSILQGITNSKEVEFSIVALKGRNLRFELRDEAGEVILPDEIRVISRDFSDYLIHKMIFSRDPGKEYNLFAFEGENVVDQRLVGKGQREDAKLKIAVASCLNDFYDKHFKIWDTLVSKNPEYLILIGDNVYATNKAIDKKQDTDPEVLWNRYLDLRLSLPLYFQQKLIPTHALWDDHDYGMNDGHREFTYKQESKEVFDAFWAQDLSGENWSKGYGVGGLLTLGDFNLYFLDARTFRSEESHGKHLGIDQSAWLYSKLKEEETPSFIIKGDQFFGGYHPFDSFEGRHPEDFQEFVTELKKLKTPFIFLSGDRHMSEIMQFPRSLFGRPGFEITSSPMHGKVISDTPSNPWRVVSALEKVNFTLIDSLAKDNHWFMDVTNIGENGDVHYKRELAVYIKDLQDNLKEKRKRRYIKRRYRKIRSKRRR
ncbi:MAG: hypothetical protein ACLGHN_00850 [Bacteriovoracia bacterium]